MWGRGEKVFVFGVKVWCLNVGVLKNVYGVMLYVGGEWVGKV